MSARANTELLPLNIFLSSFALDSKLQIAAQILNLHSEADFTAFAESVFKYQIVNNTVYREFVENIGHSHFDQPAFLPIELFKSRIVSCHDKSSIDFKSSGTTAEGRSTHFVFDAALYEKLSKAHFESIYGSLDKYTILALLPSYLENGESSLVYMVDHFMQHAQAGSEFVLHKPTLLAEKLKILAAEKKPTILFGVSYALLDFAESYSIRFPELVIMETGGMKGRRKELTREQLHQEIKKGFPASAIHSEYGMTELLSQGYCSDGEWFRPPFWMRAFAIDISDPFEILKPERRGLLAFIDLANYHSCAFVQTKDIGIVLPDGRFKVEGRLDHSDLRGCNLLYTQ